MISFEESILRNAQSNLLGLVVLYDGEMDIGRTLLQCDYRVNFHKFNWKF